MSADERESEDQEFPQSDSDRVEILRRFVADRARGDSRSIDEYQDLFPGLEDLVKQELEGAIEVLGSEGSDGNPNSVVTSEGEAPRRGRLQPGMGRISRNDNEAITLGPYELREEVGRGGQAIVYRAHDPRLGREVAIKVLRGLGPQKKRILARFQREAAVTARLDHPGICKVLETGVDDDIAWIAMPFVHGESLSSKISAAKSSEPATLAADGSLWEGETDRDLKPRSDDLSTPTDRHQINTVLKLVEETARALHAAHEAGVVHRDIKPANLIVTPGGQPVILDFGLAKEIEAEDATLTQSGDLMGTPAYMSPEQLTVHRIRLDRRTDVYSLGVLLYECLTLERPFTGPTREALYQAILSKQPPDIRKSNRAVSSDLKIVCETALDKDRDRRYQSAEELADDLRRVRMSEPIAAKPVGPVGRTLRWAKRRPAAAALAFVLLLGIPVVTGLGGFIVANLDDIEAQRAENERLAIETLLERGYLALMEGSPEPAEAPLAEALDRDPDNVEALAGLCWAQLDRGEDATALALLNRHGDLVAEHPALQRLLKDAADASLREKAVPEELLELEVSEDLFVLGLREMRRGKKQPTLAYEPSFRLLQRAVALRPHAPRLLYQLQLVRAASRADHHEESARLADALVRLWPDSAYAWYGKGFVAADVEELAASSEEANRRALELDPEFAYAFLNLALALHNMDRLDEAEAALERVLDLRPNLATAWSNRASVAVDLDRRELALTYSDRAIQTDPDLWFAYNNKIRNLRSLGRAEEAMELAKLAHERFPLVPRIQREYGWCLNRAGKKREGAEFSRRAYEMAPKDPYLVSMLGLALEPFPESADERARLFREHIELGDSAEGRRGLGKALKERGDTKGAIREFRRAIELEPEYHLALESLSIELNRQGEYDEALTLIDRALEVAPKTSYYLSHRSTVLENMKRHDEAFAVIDELISLRPSDKYYYYRLAFALRAVGRAEEALVAIDKALELKPDYATGHEERGRILSALGRYEERNAAYRRAVEIKPDYAKAWRSLSWAEGNGDRWKEAEQAALKATEIEPGSVDAWNYLARARNGLGKHLEAHAAIGKSLEINTRGAYAQELLVENLLARNHLDEALAAARRFVETHPRDVDAHRLLGDVCETLGDMPGAVSARRTRTEIDGGKSVSSLANLSKSLADMYEIDEAIRLAQLVIELDPESSWAHWYLAHAQRAACNYHESLAAFREYKKRLEVAGGTNVGIDDDIRNMGNFVAVMMKLEASGGSFANFDGTPAQLGHVGRLAMHEGEVVAAARLYERALREGGDELNSIERAYDYNAACAALRAARSLAEDEDPTGRKHWRKLAHEWAMGYLTRRRAWIAEDKVKPKGQLMNLGWMRHDADLADIRGQEAISALPLEERGAWLLFWYEHERLVRDIKRQIRKP